MIGLLSSVTGLHLRSIMSNGGAPFNLWNARSRNWRFDRPDVWSSVTLDEG